MSFKGIHSKLIALFSILLTILFVYTAVSKLIHLELFQIRLERMPFISPFAQWISWGIPFLELVIAGLLLLHRYRVIGLWASVVLLGLFTIYIMAVLQFSDSIPCSCGGIISILGWRDHIILNITFMIFALLGIIWSKNKTTLSQIKILRSDRGSRKPKKE